MALAQTISKKMIINITAFMIGLAAATTAKADVITGEDSYNNPLVQNATMDNDTEISEDAALIQVGNRRNRGFRRGRRHNRHFGHRRGYRRGYFGHRRGHSSHRRRHHGGHHGSRRNRHFGHRRGHSS